MIRYGILKTACLLAASFLVTACTDDVADGTALPPGEYPMTFATALEGPTQTGTTTENTWAGNERIAVKVGDEVKEYKPASGNSSTLTAVDAAHPFYWQKADETKEVSAWYCGDGSTASGQQYATQLPTTWTVKTDQSSEGYEQSDFLYAPKTDISFTQNNAVLKFYHQTAKIIINIKNGGATTEADQITRVVIGNAANLALSGMYIPPMAEVIEATWDTTVGTPTMGTIIPKEISVTGSSYLKSYTALIIPQNMAGKQFIAVTLTNGITYYYTPQKQEANLQSGKLHTYDITVKNNYLEVITATVSGEWSGGDIEEIGSNPTQ